MEGVSEKVHPKILKVFEIVEKLGEGGNGIVWKAIHKKKMILCALKKYENVYETKLKAQRMYREIEILSQLQAHENIISLYEAFECSTETESDIYIVLKYMDSDLQKAIKSSLLNKFHIGHILLQLLKATCFMHAKGCVHRDIKPSNILIDKESNIKLADFGLTRHFNIILEDEPDEMTNYVASRWYRAPEILLGSSMYTEKADMWSIGCVFAELLLGRVLFDGTSTLDQLRKIFSFLGRPSNSDLAAINSPMSETMLLATKNTYKKSLNELLEGASPEALDLLQKLLLINPKKRLSAKDALRHPYMSQLIIGDRLLYARYDNEEFVKMEFDDSILYDISEYKNYIRKLMDEKIIKRRRIENKDISLHQMAKKKRREVHNKQRSAYHRASLFISTVDQRSKTRNETFYEGWKKN